MNQEKIEELKRQLLEEQKNSTRQRKPTQRKRATISTAAPVEIPAVQEAKEEVKQEVKEVKEETKSSKKRKRPDSVADLLSKLVYAHANTGNTSSSKIKKPRKESAWLKYMKAHPNVPLSELGPKWQKEKENLLKVK